MTVVGKAEGISLRIVTETSPGVPPTSGWLTLQPDQGGVTDFYGAISTVAPMPVSTFTQDEAPEIVDLDAAPKFAGDLTMDHLYALRENWMLVKTVHNGGTGQSRFAVSAVSSTVFTVAALGNLPQGTLISCKGFTNAANNGLKVVGAGSTGTTIPTTGLVAETVSGYVPYVEVAGFRASSGDITVDSSGNILSTVLDFTTLGLAVGQVIYFGGAPGTAFTSASGYTGFVKITAIAAHQLTTSVVTRQWTQGAADTGTGKTMDLRYNSWLREVAIDDANYQEPTQQLELTIPSISAGSTVFCYATAQQIDNLEITAAEKALTKMAVSFIGQFVTKPSTSRITGPSTAQAVLERSRFTAVTKTAYIRLLDATTGATVSNRFKSWKLAKKNNVGPQKQQGTLGTAFTVVGRRNVALDFELYVDQVEAINAAQDNTTLTWGAGLRNGDGGVFFEVPSLKITKAPTTFPANGPVMLSATNAGFRDAVGNYTLGVSMFSDLPVTGPLP